MYDLIGDIHGHADELVALLEILGYQKSKSVYAHPERKVIFLGDFIDRGRQIREVLEIVRPMVEENNALAIMGNHELNALAFHAEHSTFSGTYLRKRTLKNIRQHGQTILQLSDKELEHALAWFRTLPMWLDLEGLRAVHACWDERSIAYIARMLAEHNGISPELLHSAYQKENDLFAHMGIILKGKEAVLPEGMFFHDKNGHERNKMRTRWYLPPEHQTYRTYALQSHEVDCDLPIDSAVVKAAECYPASAKPVFVGHYWLTAQEPQILAENVACLDYSVAKGGFLCSYRWNGERKLSNGNFVWVRKS